MPNLKVPMNAAFGRMQVVSWVEKEINKRVDSTKHLPDDDIRKYKTKTTQEWNQAVRRVEEGGQFTISQLLPPQKIAELVDEVPKTGFTTCTSTTKTNPTTKHSPATIHRSESSSSPRATTGIPTSTSDSKKNRHKGITKKAQQ